MQSKNEFLEIGKIVNTHGLYGEVKVQAWCDDVDIFNKLSHVCIGAEKYKIKGFRPHKNSVLLKLSGIDSINEAEKYRNKILTVKREALGKLPEGTYYICDLMGLGVKTEEGEALGKIEDVIQTGSNDVYVLKRENNPKPLLIPALKEVIRTVDLKNGTMTVRLMEGLMD